MLRGTICWEKTHLCRLQTVEDSQLLADKKSPFLARGFSDLRFADFGSCKAWIGWVNIFLAVGSLVVISLLNWISSSLSSPRMASNSSSYTNTAKLSVQVEYSQTWINKAENSFNPCNRAVFWHHGSGSNRTFTSQERWKINGSGSDLKAKSRSWSGSFIKKTTDPTDPNPQPWFIIRL